MALRKKTLLIIGLTFIGLIAILSIGTRQILLNSFNALEEQKTYQNVERAREALNEELLRLEVISGDYGSRDDTYSFIEDVNEDFIKSKISIQTFTRLRLNVMLFINASGRIVYGASYDLKNGKETTVPNSLKQQISINNPLLRQKNMRSVVTGIMILPEGLMLIASAPIQTNQGTAPIRGTLIIGRYFTMGEIKHLGNVTHLTLNIFSLNDFKDPAERETVNLLSRRLPMRICIINSEIIRGYALLIDVYEKPVLVLCVDMPRLIYKQGLTTFRYGVLSLIIVGIGFCIVILLILEGSVLSRIVNLDKSVGHITRSSDITKRIFLGGRDELSNLANSINQMLETLQHSQLELQESELRFRTLVEQSLIGVYLISENKFTYSNEAGARILGYSIDEITGQLALIDVVHSDDRSIIEETFKKMMEGQLENTQGSIRCLRKDESVIYCEIFGKRITYKGKLTILCMILDITERKRVENAIRQAERFLASIFASIQDGISILDNELNIVQVNPTMERWHSNAMPLVGKKCYEVYHGRSKPCEICPTLQTIKTHRSANEVIPKISSDGTVVGWLDLYSFPLFDMETGQMTGVIEYVRDITERKRAEEALRREQDLVSRIMETSPVCITMVNRSGQIIFANARAEQVLGLSRDKITQLTYNDSEWHITDFDGNLFPDEELPFRRVITTGKPVYEIQHAIQWPNGRRVLLSINSAPLFDELGRVDGMVSAIEDITERKMAEKALQYRVEFEKIITSISTSFINLSLKEVDGGINYALQRVGEFAGVDRSYVFLFYDDGKKMDNTHEWCAEGVKPSIQNLKGLLVDNFPWFMEKMKKFEIVYIPNVDELPPEASAEKEIFQPQGIKSLINVPMFYQGVLIGFLGFDLVRGEKTWSEDVIALLKIVGEIFINALKRKEGEMALRESQERYRNLVETIKEWIWEIDASGLYAYSSPRLKDILGYEPEEVLGKTPFCLMPPEEADRVREIFREFVAEKKPIIALENTYIHKDGHKVIMETSGVPFFAPDGTLLGYRGVDRDITERKKFEEEQKRIEAQIQQAQKLESLGILAGGIAHDFNNLLVGILGNSDLAQMEISPSSLAQMYLTQVRTAAQRAADLCRQMLAYAGKGRFVIQPIDLTEIVEEMAHLLEISISKNAILRYNLGQNLPKIEADVTQIRQVIMNLITNASDAIEGKQGVITIVTGVMECDRNYLSNTYINEERSEGQYVYLEVSDTGIGMDEVTKEKIFDPFFTTKFTGRGLGLAAVLGIVRVHKGSVKVYSEPNRGSTFKILFPAASKDIELEPPVESVSKKWKGEGTILVIDDEETVRSVTKRLLEVTGFKVLIAKDGTEGIEIFRKNTSEIIGILLDLTMPYLSGEETFCELRRIKENIKVILMSGYTEQDATNRFAGKGLTGFIQKPFRIDDLQRIVTRFTNKS